MPRIGEALLQCARLSPEAANRRFALTATRVAGKRGYPCRESPGTIQGRGQAPASLVLCVLSSLVYDSSLFPSYTVASMADERDIERLKLDLERLGDHLNTGHLWSLQNRPLWMA